MMAEFVTIPSDGWNLHGLVHLPRRVAGQRVGVVLLHENINTKFGTHRLYRRLAQRGKPHNLATVAVARELACFLWTAAVAPP